MLDRCGFCGGADGPFTRVDGVFTVLMCPTCLANRGRGRGPYPELTDAELRAGLDLLPTWALAQKAAANRQVIAIMGGRLERGEPVARRRTTVQSRDEGARGADSCTTAH